METILVEKDFKATLGISIKRMREQSNLTQKELSQSIGLTRASIANMEAGTQNPTIYQLYMICIRLKITPDEIFPSFFCFKNEIQISNKKKDIENVIEAMHSVGIKYNREILNALL